VVAAALLGAPAAGAANPIQEENARPATPGWATVQPTSAIEGTTTATRVVRVTRPRGR
jgi:hypothetical protein